MELILTRFPVPGNSEIILCLAIRQLGLRLVGPVTDENISLVSAALNHNREAAFTISSAVRQALGSRNPGLVTEGKRPWVPEIRDSQGTRDVSRVMSAHTGWVEWGLGWQLLTDFREGKRAKNQRHQS